MATYKALNNLKLNNSPVKKLSQLYKNASKYNETNLIGTSTQTNYIFGQDFNIDGETHTVVSKGFFDYSSNYSLNQSKMIGQEMYINGVLEIEVKGLNVTIANVNAAQKNVEKYNKLTSNAYKKNDNLIGGGANDFLWGYELSLIHI